MSKFDKTQLLAKDLLEVINRLQPQRKIVTTNGTRQLVETRKNQPTVTLPVGQRFEISSRSGSFR